MLTGIARSILSVLEEAATKSVEALDITQRACLFSFVTWLFDVFKLRHFHCVSHAGHGTCYYTHHRDSVRALVEVGRPTTSWQLQQHPAN